jgi:hypothetical protein
MRSTQDKIALWCEQAQANTLSCVNSSAHSILSNSDPLQAALALSTRYGEGAMRSAPILPALVLPLGVITSGLSGLHSILLPGRALEPTAPINARVEHALWSSLCRRSRAHCEPRRGLLHRTVKHRVRRRAVDLRFFSGGNSSLSTRRADEVSPLHRAAPLLLSGPVKRLSAPGPSRWVFRIEYTTHTGRSLVVITV